MRMCMCFTDTDGLVVVPLCIDTMTVPLSVETETTVCGRTGDSRR